MCQYTSIGELESRKLAEIIVCSEGLVLSLAIAQKT